jgi:hypothetical protein
VSGRTLELVSRAQDAGSPRTNRDVVVLDTAWTPGAGDRADLLPLRPVLQRVFERVNVVDDSLALLDDWADRARAADAFTIDGTTWWFRVRMLLRWDVQELLIWRYVLGELAPAGRYERVVVPPDRPHLAAVGRAARQGSAPTQSLIHI